MIQKLLFCRYTPDGPLQIPVAAESTNKIGNWLPLSAKAKS